MKILKLYIVGILLTFVSINRGEAQPFSTQYDTAYGNAHFCPMTTFKDTIISFATVDMYWKIIASNFPSDWIPHINMVDNSTAINNLGFILWNGTTGSLFHAVYSPSSSGNFACYMELAGTTTMGTHWLKVQLTDSNTFYSKDIVFVISRIPDTVLPNPGIITGGSSVCMGSNITLGKTVTGGTWSVTNGHAAVAGGIVTPISIGIDTVKYTITNTCGAVSAIKEITINPLPVPVVSVVGGSLSTSSTYSIYQWYLATTPISGATDATYNAVSNGTYYVTVTDANGCTGTSSAVNVLNVGIEDINFMSNNIEIYPNPAASFVSIKSSKKIIVSITTLEGNIVTDKCAVNKINLSNLPNGIYMLNIYDDEDKVKLRTEKIIKFN